MGELTLRNVTKCYGKFIAVNNIDLDICDGEFLVLVGPSGCGKTTTLRMIAGLESIDDGKIYINGKLINDLAPKDRDIAMVFQSYALYPHMDVYSNMAFGLKMRGMSQPERDEIVNNAAEILGLKEYLHRKPKELSGGQRQRVALGRAIVRKPEVFLFDEPLSNLDAKLRVKTRTELKKLHHTLRTTMVYVTHDQVEAMTMGDRIVIMKDGVIHQVGTPMDLYNRPSNTFVAGFIGSPAMNFIPCRLRANGLEMTLDADDFSITIPEEIAKRLIPWIDNELILGMRPEDFSESRNNSKMNTNRNVISATVNVIEMLGKETCLDVNTAKHSLMVILPCETKVKENSQIELVPNLDKMHFFKKDTGESIGNPK